MRATAPALAGNRGVPGERGLVRVLVLESFAEAQVVGALLAARDAPYLIRPFNDPAFGSFWRAAGGWGELLSYAEHRGEIGELCLSLRGLGRSSQNPTERAGRRP